MRVHFPQFHNKTEGTAWHHSMATLVARLNDPNLIAVVLFCLIALLIVAGGLRWEEWYVATQVPSHAPFGAAPLCFVNTCFVF